jgi:hypothetical protein
MVRRVRSNALAKANAPEVVAALDSGNQFWSLTAQRLIVDNKMTDAAPGFEEACALRAAGARARFTRSGRSKASARSTRTHIRRRCSTRIPRCVVTPIRALPANEAGRQLFFSSPVIQDPDCSRGQVAFVKLADVFRPFPKSRRSVCAVCPRIPAQRQRQLPNDTVTAAWAASIKSPASSKRGEGGGMRRKVGAKICSTTTRWRRARPAHGQWQGR